MIGTLLIASSLAPALLHAAPPTMPNDSWQLLVVPGYSARIDIGTLFGSTLPAAEYGRRWSIFVLDGSGYVEPALNASIPTGSAFWLIQQTGTDVVLDASVPTPDARLLPGCLSSAGCVALQLDSRSGEGVWNAIGMPSSRVTPLADLRVTTASGSCVDGCDLDEASAQGITGGSVWTYDAANARYAELGIEERLSPWQGFWFWSADVPGGVELLVPFDELDLEYCV